MLQHWTLRDQNRNLLSQDRFGIKGRIESEASWHRERNRPIHRTNEFILCPRAEPRGQLKDELGEVVAELEALDGQEECKQSSKAKQMSIGRKKFNMDPKKVINALRLQCATIARNALIKNASRLFLAAVVPVRLCGPGAVFPRPASPLRALVRRSIDVLYSCYARRVLYPTLPAL
ncbi:Cytohesin-1 [Eumeta japonica]|uniref:Cytohesin-1 n=1 Tax=Eumeta variegata TaxID=151549 RepID=A0A4C1TVS3_EUMVA|nr:Cytohesin-1 [Eumeta japonica]